MVDTTQYRYRCSVEGPSLRDIAEIERAFVAYHTLHGEITFSTNRTTNLPTVRCDYCGARYELLPVVSFLVLDPSVGVPCETIPTGSIDPSRAAGGVERENYPEWEMAPDD